MQPVNADCLFRVKDRTPQAWDPADGSMEPLFIYEAVDGRTSVRLDLPPGGSIFVVFGQNIPSFNTDTAIFQCFQNGNYTLTDSNGQTKQVKVDTLPAPVMLAGEWTIDFDPEWGPPAQIKLPKLISWTEHENEGVKYYSGAGFYTKTLDVPVDWLASGRRVHLDLGDVRDVAEVFVNSKSAGVLWKAPFRVDITSLVKPGANKLKIEVMNMWINRLVGDQYLPEEKKFTRTNIRTFDGFRAKPGTIWSVQPAGLLGPVRLLPSKEVMVNMDGELHTYDSKLHTQKHGPITR